MQLTRMLSPVGAGSYACTPVTMNAVGMTTGAAVLLTTSMAAVSRPVGAEGKPARRSGRARRREGISASAPPVLGHDN
ncbi:MAG: hypothetical protein LC749_04655 [Actinobacteria bacterium]|nr:hypothetical protein [Actinomycetota bacterium]